MLVRLVLARALYQPAPLLHIEILRSLAARLSVVNAFHAATQAVGRGTLTVLRFGLLHCATEVSRAVTGELAGLQFGKNIVA